MRLILILVVLINTSTCYATTLLQESESGMTTMGPTLHLNQTVLADDSRPCRKEKEKCGRRKQKVYRLRHKQMNFQVVRIGLTRGGSGGKSKKSQDKQASQGSANGQTQDKMYGRWSRWTTCTWACNTYRTRQCKRRGSCGKAEVMRESAYCYTQGSFCQTWIQTKLRENNEENEADSDRQKPETACGVPWSGSRSTGNMLRIIGGRPTPRGRWPWQVAVLNKFKEAFCGGTLVAPRWILTAAHCLRKRLYVRLGEHDLSTADDMEMELLVESMIEHPSYDAETVNNDVALLRLPVNVHPDPYRGFACLPRFRQPLPTRKYCTIIGWGKRVSSDMFGTDVLHQAEVPIVSNDVCRRVYEDYHITNNMFCAGYRRGRMDSCAGDSGGPLLCREGHRWIIFGITSFGEGCGKRGKYGIYTKVSNYIRWIQHYVNARES